MVQTASRELPAVPTDGYVGVGRLGAGVCFQWGEHCSGNWGGRGSRSEHEEGLGRYLRSKNNDIGQFIPYMG